MAGKKPTDEDVARARAAMERMRVLAEQQLHAVVVALTPYVRKRATQALREAQGEQKAAEGLLERWAKKDDKLWRQLREPYEPRRYRPSALVVAIREAAARSAAVGTGTRSGGDPT
jgi:hypothetical protein